MLCFLLLAFSLLFHRADATWLCHGEELQQDSQEGRLEGNTAARWTPPSGAPLPAPGNHGEPRQSPPERTPSWSVDIRAWQLTFSLPLPQCGMPLTISFLFTYKMLYNFQLQLQLLKVFGETNFSKAALLVSFTFFEDWSWEEIAQKIYNVGSERVNHHSNKGTVHSQVL